MLYDLLRDLEQRRVVLTPTETGFAAGPVAALEGLITELRLHKDAITELLHTVGHGSSAGTLLDVYLGGHTVIRTDDELRTVVERLCAASAVAVDLETTGLDPRSDRIRLVSLADDRQTFVVDVDAVTLPAVRQHMTTLLQSNAVLIFHHAGFDLEFLAEAGVDAGPTRLYDTGIAEQLIQHTAKMPSLRSLAEAYLSLALDKSVQTSDWRGAISERQLRYAALDARVTYLIHVKQRGLLRLYGLQRAAQIDFDAIRAVVWMRRAGVPFDAERWFSVVNEATQQAAEALNRLDPFVNWNSPAQAVNALRLAGVSVEDTQYETLVRHRGHPLVDALLAYREHQKRISTYGTDWVKHIHPRTGRIHPSWRVIGAETGRMSCTDPNLMQVPRTTAYRRCFRAPEGRVLVKADYSQIELRLAALIANDNTMLTAFANGEDLHTKTAMAITGKPANEITKADRQLAKALNFGLLYGMGPDTLRVYAQTGYGVVLSAADAERFRDVFFTTYPGLRAWHRAQPRDEVVVRTLSGRRRVVEKFTEKVNTPVQGSGADMIKRALAILYERRHELPDVVPILAVHDEIVLEAPAHLAAHAKHHLERAMLDAAHEITGGKVPVVVEAGVYTDWGVTNVTA